MKLRDLDAFHFLPGVSLWRKNSDSIFVDVNQEYSQLFGFKCADQVIGKTDADVPCKAANIANVFQENDKEVIRNKEVVKFLEILQVANDVWKILLIVKTPYYDNHQCVGTSAYCIEVPHFQYHKLGIAPQSSSLKQVSFKIIKNNQLLTSREVEFFFLFLRQKTVEEIAFLWGVSPQTVEEILSSIKTKMGCYTDRQLQTEAIERNFLNIIPESLIQCDPLNYASFYRLLSDDVDNLQFSKRQFDCLLQLVKGMTVKEIGKALNISPRTVEDHLTIIKKRLNCSSRSSLISKALTLKAIKERLL